MQGEVQQQARGVMVERYFTLELWGIIHSSTLTHVVHECKIQRLSDWAVLNLLT